MLNIRVVAIADNGITKYRIPLVIEHRNDALTVNQILAILASEFSYRLLDLREDRKINTNSLKAYFDYSDYRVEYELNMGKTMYRLASKSGVICSDSSPAYFVHHVHHFFNP